jgi:hypothetical protein
MNDLMLAAAAGCVATLPMTIAMEAMHGELPPEEQYPLPPRTVALRAADRAGIEENLDEGERTGLTLVSHFGMGTAMGALYGPVSRFIPLPAPLAGAAFGLAVWAGNYLGILPALGLLSSATRHPRRRVGLMIAAHLVWGAAAGLVVGAARGGESGKEEALRG